MISVAGLAIDSRMLVSASIFFIFAQDEVYAGQVVGEHSKEIDLVVNVTKSKQLTNMRSKSSLYWSKSLSKMQKSMLLNTWTKQAKV